MSEHIDLSQEAGVLTIRMNRPERKNALTADMYAAMGDALKKAEADPDCRVALFLGTEGVYTAGNDIKDFLETPPVGPDAPVSRFIGFLARTDLPLVAAVDGPAVGIGTTMLLHCDFVHVTESAMLQMPFVDLALVPEAGSSFLLPRLMGHARAAELLMLGKRFDGREAVELGIANRLTPAGELEAAAYETAHALAAKPPKALRTTKALLRQSEDHLRHAMEREGKAFGEGLHSAEAKEAFSAFLEKRKPDFSNLA